MTTAIPPPQIANQIYQNASKVGYALNEKDDRLMAQTPYCFGPQKAATFEASQAPYISSNPGDLVGIGASIASSGEDTRFRRLTVLNRGLKGDQFCTTSTQGPIYTQTSAYNSQKTNPMYGEYNEELWQTPYDREEEKESLGVFTNVYTNETSELYQNAMPAPTTARYSYDPTVSKTTNPRLLWMTGGQNDPNRPRPNKKEVELFMQGSDAGPNPWGTQAYNDAAGALQQNIIQRQIFNNRNGIYACEQGFAKEVPAGNVGLQNMFRWTPYLPPTQQLDLKNWLPTAGLPEEYLHGSTNPLIVPDSFTNKKNDLTNHFYTGGANVLIGDYIPATDVNKQTTRGIPGGINGGAGTSTTLMGQVSGMDGLGGHVILDYDPRATLKPFTMEKAFPSMNVNAEALGGYVLLDYDPRASMKTATMETAHPTLNANAELTGGYANSDLQDNGETRRQFYSADAAPVFVAPNELTGGELLGPGAVTFKNYRGDLDTYALNEHPVRIPAEVTDTQSRWVGQSERDSRTDKGPNIPAADFVSNGNVYLTGRACVGETHEPWKMKEVAYNDSRSGLGGAGGIYQGVYA